MKRMISEQREDGLINFGDSFGRRAEFLKKTVKKEIAQMKGENVSKGRNQNGEEKEEKQEIEGKEANAIHNDVKENENEKENIFNENYENNKQQQQQQQQQIVSLQNSQFEQSFSDFGNLKAISHKNSSANGFFVSSIPHSLHSFDSSHSEEPSNRRKSTADTALSQNLMDRRNIMQKQETEQRNNESGTVEEKTMNANDYYNNEMENAEDRVKQNAQRMLDIILPFLEEKMSSNASSTSSSFSSLPPSSSAVSTCTNTVPVHIPKPSFFEEEEAISLPIQKVPSLDQTANRAGLNDASSASLVGYSSLPVLPQCKQNSFSSAMGIASSNELEKKEANGFVESNSIDNPDGVLV
ncbi:uncharacterized protein MONOS_8953 [Monocercomonoides exilis]|uniref:uncharacterized protein n=1 Tax=Monocercomonoides exilis TaxID=2049356 RepID=UPI00355987B5|nr:hypothetical protein MONOS_8953 [Monocercomonoides exilis]|eukprot:MONOS_8953.1-p1 / transcript=MONOS_8953.1 / gene=MONOS_8953 / organism=Monocercomonoides_exilis_PA203 / gene_product=unspecified product / transcript_product=unspecified product / location=Mono_scaffold00353:10837-11898(-) / protein_length=354 / sequence_SO=supercontig / SO=protein_coding / is_pseudo=false